MELITTIILLTMAGLSMMFWYLEYKQWAPALEKAPWFRPKLQQGVIGAIVNPFLLAYAVLANIGTFITTFGAGRYFIADITCTLLLSMVFGLGGVLGTAMGLTMSNVLSVMLIFNMYKSKA